MKNIIIIIAAVCLLPVTAFAQGKFTIKGHIKETQGFQMAYLRYSDDDKRVVDSVQIIRGKFTLSNTVSTLPAAQLIVSHQDKSPDVLEIYLEPKQMNVISKTGYVKDAFILGSRVNDDNKLFSAQFKQLNETGNTLMKQWLGKSEQERQDTAVLNSYRQKQMAYQKDIKNLRKQFYSAHRDSYIGLVAYASNDEIDVKDKLETTDEEFNKFSSEVRKMGLGVMIGGMIDGAKKSKVGLPAIDFTQNDVNDQPVKLSDFRGKYVLLDFWASWCSPCRAESLVLVKAYAKFKHKNFTILSVSLDQPGKWDHWVKAIEKDRLEWTNVSDLKYWKNEVAVKYGVTSIPANFLIGPSGKIIAKDLRGENLERKLAQLTE